MPGLGLQRIEEEKVLAGEALAGHYVRRGTEIGHIQPVLRGRNLPVQLPAGPLVQLRAGNRKIGAEGFLEMVVPMQAVAALDELLGTGPGVGHILPVREPSCENQG